MKNRAKDEKIYEMLASIVGLAISRMNEGTTEKSVRIYDLVEVIAQAMGFHS